MSALPVLGDTSQLDSLVNVQAAGGKDVGAFSASGTAPAALNWTNRDQLTTVTRAQPLTFNWTGGDAKAPVFAAGFAVDLPDNASGMFLCVASPGATSFTVPANVLANLPITPARLSQSLSAVYLGQWNVNAPGSFSGTGLDTGQLTVASVSGRPVVIQ